MKTAEQSRVGRTIGHMKKTWAEPEYAQRRMFEIRTGVGGSPTAHAQPAAKVGVRIDAQRPRPAKQLPTTPERS